jgi:SAM-dependent methyltransferase
VALRDRLLARRAAYHAFKVAIGADRVMDEIARQHVRAAPGDQLLDIGCGDGDIRSRFVGVDYVGVDLNPDYIRAAKAMEDAHTRFLLGDVGRLDELTALAGRSFDICYAFGVLHHLSDDEARAMLASARAFLVPGGRFVSVDAVFDPEQSTVARVLAALDRGRHVRDVDGYRRLAESVFPEVDVTLRSDLLRLPYTHCIMECRVRPLGEGTPDG